MPKTTLGAVLCCVARAMVYIPEAADIDALLRVTFAGPSAALLHGETRAHCGEAAQTALVESRRGAEAGLALRGGRGFGLLLVHSHRQRAAEFKQHARMMSLISRTLPKDNDLLHQLSLLIVNNDGSEMLPHGPWHGTTDDPLKWLQLYSIPLRIRMLIVTSLNLGYVCGELQALVAAAPVVQHFPWVLYCSGPDVLPTPAGVLRLGAEVARSWKQQSQSAFRSATAAAAAALLYLHFPAPVGRQRISLDLFLFFPRPLGTLWSTASRRCLEAASRAATEQIVAEAAIETNVSKLDLWMNGYMIWREAKLLSTGPRSDNAALWHTHNLTALSAWLDGQERAHNLTQELPLSGRLHCRNARSLG